MTNMETAQSTLLIVDDVPENIRVLYEFLTAHGFKVLVAEDGENAIEKAHYAEPNLILLDIIMPGLDGFSTCYHLKQDEKTKDIPIIFMTALSDTDDKVRGFKMGAVDYVTKPFQQEEILARINTHLTIRRLQKQLQNQNAELDAFGHTVAHDLKSPLGSVIVLAELLEQTTAHVLDAKSLKHLTYLRQAAHKMADIINALLLLAGVSKQKVELDALNMTEILQQVRDRLAHMIKEYQAEVSIPNQWPLARGYAPWVEEIWVNYITNGLKYGGSPPYLELGATRIGADVQFWVRDNGEGLSPEAQANLFTPFTRLNQEQAQGYGLGLSIVQRVAEKLGGRVGVQSQVGHGCTFYFTLPLA